MKKKVLSLLLGASLLATGVVGCGQTSGDTGSTGGSSTAPVASAAPAWTPGQMSILVPGKAGGGSDLTTRALVNNWQTAEPAMKIAVENYDNTAVCYQTIKAEKPNGEKLSLAHTGLLTQYVTGSLDVNPEKDLTVIAQIGNNGLNALAVPADAPYDTFDEFVEYAKANPGAIKAGIGPNGISHFVVGVMEQELGIEFTYVEAANQADRLTGVAGGFLDLGTITLASGIEYEQAGKLKILATIGSAGSVSEDFYPGRPDNFRTIEEQGYDCAIGTNYYLVGPAGMDPAMVEAINASIKPIGDDGSSYKEEMSKIGQIGEWHNVPDSQKLLADEVVAISDVAKGLGIYGVK